MKTAEEIADEVFDPRRDCFARVDLVHLLRVYGSQVREEAAKIADLGANEGPVYCERHDCIAAAIRKMELP